MKIVFFIGEFNGGGAERVISILANKMVERNFDVEILKYYDSENLYQTNSKVVIKSIEENTNSKNIIINLKWLRNYFRNNGDFIISFLAPFNMLSIVANIGSGKPIIVADRNDPRIIPKNPIIRLFRNILYRFADGVVLQTKENKLYFSNYVQNKSVVINNPIDLNNKKGIALDTKKENMIVSVARLEKQKNHEMLIKAFKNISNKYQDYKLVIYGEGTYRNNLEKLIDELELNEKVILTGNKNNVLDLICKAKLFILCSNYEGMSNSLIEAMCIGLPVISTKVSGTNETIEDGNNGLLIDINNQEQLYEAMERIIKDDTFASKLAKNATNISEKFDSDKVVDKWIDYINSIKK